MTINEIYRLIQFYYNKDQSGNITPEQFNLITPRAQMSFIHNLITPKYDERGEKKGWQSDQSIRKDLRTIIKPKHSITPAAGIAAYPGDYIDFDTMTTNGGYVMNEVTMDEADILNKSLIKPPTATSAKFAQSQDGLHIFPNTLTPVLLTYIRKPVDPVWNYTFSDGIAVYAATGGVLSSGNSVELELPEPTHHRIVMILAQMVGINLTLPDIVQFGMIKEKEGI